jgi:methylase of polypeptide subunit release factors
LLLLPFDAGHVLPLRRAPAVAQACAEAHGPAAAPYVMALRELLGIVGAHEWRKNGIAIASLGARIHPHSGVFAPIRTEYVDLVASAPFAGALPRTAFDIGTGTGVLAAVLAQRGVARVVATESDVRAVACARENVTRLGLAARIEVVLQPFFPGGCADLVVCNPPWLPGRPSASIERAIFDPDSEMLRGFLRGLAGHLAPRGEGWLILSDFAERLGMRSRDWLLQQFSAAGLAVAGRLDTQPRHPKAADAADPLHAVRAAEVVSLWRLTAVDPQSPPGPSAT